MRQKYPIQFTTHNRHLIKQYHASCGEFHSSLLLGFLCVPWFADRFWWCICGLPWDDGEVGDGHWGNGGRAKDWGACVTLASAGEQMRGWMCSHSHTGERLHPVVPRKCLFEHHLIKLVMLMCFGCNLTLTQLQISTHAKWFRWFQVRQLKSERRS